MKQIIGCLVLLSLIFSQIPNPVHASEFSYKWISQSSYPSLFPDETTRIWMLLENTGTSTWDKSIPIHLATDRNQDRASDFYTANDWLSPNRPSWLTDETIIKPGERAVFMFVITAPKKPGVYREYFRPVIENVGWLDDYGIYWEITVKDPKNEALIPHDPEQNYSTDGIYRSELISQDSQSVVLKPGESKTLNIQIKNIGTATWHNLGSHPTRLATAQDWDRNSIFKDGNWLSANRVVNINENNIGPSQTASYSLTLKAPDNISPGIYNESFQSVCEGVTWFMDYNIKYQIIITSSDSTYGQLLSATQVDEFLDGNQYLTITDLANKKSMRVKTIGMDRWHADVVPLTLNDTQQIRDIYNFRKDFVPWCPGDDWTLWMPNAVTVQIDSDPLHRTIAAAIDGCAHDVDGGITDNGFPGHFDLHFLDSMMHGKEEVDCSFQKMVQKAAGNPDWSIYGQATPCWNPCVGGGC